MSELTDINNECSEDFSVENLGKVLKIKLKDENSEIYIDTKDVSLTKFYFDKGICYFYSKFSNLPFVHIPTGIGTKLSKKELKLIQEAYEKTIKR